MEVEEELSGSGILLTEEENSDRHQEDIQ